jgi:hypothetical protein
MHHSTIFVKPGRILRGLIQEVFRYVKIKFPFAPLLIMPALRPHTQAYETRSKSLKAAAKAALTSSVVSLMLSH